MGVPRDSRYMFFCMLFFCFRISPQKKCCFEPGIHSPDKSLAYKIPFAFGHLVLKQALAEEWKWIVHASAIYAIDAC